MIIINEDISFPAKRFSKRGNLFKYILQLFAISFCIFNVGYGQSVQIIDGWYYINGEKFFVKGIGYETHTRPGQVPWVYSFDPDLIRYDLNRIKNAGFNTIRTWGALSEEELQLVEESGLKILFGIWIDPAGDFSDPSFSNEAFNQVNNVLNYSANYNSIIGYLIMNEPQVQHIYNAGAQSLADLWQSIIDLIHQKDPGIPVSFSNTIIGDYINMKVFDFAGYNAYIYNPVTISNSHGYGCYLHYLKENRASDIPLIVTEYGLSVSPGTPNNDYGYGGNTLEQQASGDLLMYRNLIDAGAQGNCVFQYHDGWWKGGDEFTHDPTPEEWFGLIEFSGLNDIYGTPRPVWSAYEKYNKAIITNPKNEYIYDGTVPVEFFTTPDVASFTVSSNDSVLVFGSIEGTYYSDELNLEFNEDVRDVDLIFSFFDSGSDTIKSETISILYSIREIELPEVTINISPENPTPGSTVFMKIHVITNLLFSIEDNKIDYVLHPHIGFDPGIAKSSTMTFTDNTWEYTGNFSLPFDTKVATFGAGFTISYGNFKKRISNQEIIIFGDWADPIAAPELISGIENEQTNEQIDKFKLYQNYPNPFNPTTKIKYTVPNVGTSYMKFIKIKVYDILGNEIATLVNEEKPAGNYEVEFNAHSCGGSNLSSGVYFYRLQAGEFNDTKKFVLMK